jgi:hypothetical protein
LLRNNVDIQYFGYPVGYLGVTNNHALVGSCSTTCLVSAGNTNQQTFKTQMFSSSAGGIAYAQCWAGFSSTIVIMEVLP